MEGERARFDAPTQTGRRGRDDRGIDVQTAKENRAMAVGSGSTCVAILTFALFFLYPRWVSGEVNPVLFQGTIAGIVVSLFLFVYASVFYYWFLICYWNGDPKAKTYLDRADGCVTFGLVLLVVEPAFILFTINLLDLGLIALGLGSASSCS